MRLIRKHKRILAIFIQLQMTLLLVTSAVADQCPLENAQFQWFEAAKKGNVAKLAASVRTPNFDQNQADCSGNTALHHAVMAESLDSVGFLLKSGAKRLLENSDGATPVHIAASLDDSEIFHLLLQDVWAQENAPPSIWWTVGKWYASLVAFTTLLVLFSQTS